MSEPTSVEVVGLDRIRAKVYTDVAAALREDAEAVRGMRGRIHGIEADTYITRREAAELLNEAITRSLDGWADRLEQKAALLVRA